MSCNMKKAFFICLFALLCVAQGAWAEDEWPKTWNSGTTTYTLTADGVFTVTPTNGISGAMADYDFYGGTGQFAPWYQDFKYISSVVIADGVTHVGNHSFNGVYGIYSGGLNLSSVSLSNDVQTIGDFAFFDCNMTSITIPDGVVSIGKSAFSTCGELTSIHIGDGVTTLGEDAFGTCTAVEEVYIGRNVTLPCGAFHNLGEQCYGFQ